MGKLSNSRGFLLSGGGLLLLMLLVASVTGVLPDGDASKADAAPKALECAEEVHFYAADVDQNFFGPAVEEKVDPAVEELGVRLCKDPALVVALAHAFELDGFVELNGDEQFAGKIRELISNRDLWRNTVGEIANLIGEENTVLSIETMGGSYETLYMLDGITDVPLIRKAQPDRPEFAVLRIKLADGRVINLKLDCGFQPVAQEFPNIPPVEQPPPTAPPVTVPTTAPPTTVPPTRVPPTTTTTPPPKDHTQSPVSDDENDPEEVTRPNVTAPTVVIRPPGSQPTQPAPTPTIPDPPEVQNPLPATPGPAPTTPAPPDPVGNGDTTGDGIPD